MTNIRRVVDSGLEIRVGIVVMDTNCYRVEETESFLRSLGVKQVGTDRVRFIGRGNDLVGGRKPPQLSELCGACWKSSLCVSPNGQVSPCIMAKEWPVGSIHETTLDEIVRSERLANIQARILGFSLLNF